MEDKEELRERIIESLQTIYDPEIPVSIFELGLIYNINIQPLNNVLVTMTLTAPSCPSAQEIPIEVEQKVRQVEGVSDVDVVVVWSPPWDRSMMSESAQLELGFM